MRRTIYVLNYIMIINSVQAGFLKIHSLRASGSAFPRRTVGTSSKRRAPRGEDADVESKAPPPRCEVGQAFGVVSAAKRRHHKAWGVNPRFPAAAFLSPSILFFLRAPEGGDIARCRGLFSISRLALLTTQVHINRLAVPHDRPHLAGHGVGLDRQLSRRVIAKVFDRAAAAGQVE